MKIVLIGKMRSGKDTVADYAVEKYGFTRFAFGDGIRKVCRILFPEQMKNGNKPRSLLQNVGQSMRKIDNDVWVKYCFNEIEESSQTVILNPIITDLRQPNEYQKCRKENYTIIKVSCDEETRLKRILEKNDSFKMEDLNHETELHIDTYEYDYLITNNGSLVELYEQFDEIVKNEINIRERRK